MQKGCMKRRIQIIYLLALCRKNADLCSIVRSRSFLVSAECLDMCSPRRLHWSTTASQNCGILSLFSHIWNGGLLFASSSFFFFSLSLGRTTLDLKWRHLTWIGLALSTNLRGLTQLKELFSLLFPAFCLLQKQSSHFWGNISGTVDLGLVPSFLPHYSGN